MKTTPRSEADAQKASRRTLLKDSMYDALFREAEERQSKRGNDMIQVLLVVSDADGNEREFRDYLSDATLGAAKLRHACEAVGALAKYEAGQIEQADFPGHACRVHVGIEKKRGFQDRNVILDYAPASPVFTLRQVG